MTKEGMTMYQTVLFDLDGTLTNPELGITTCVAYALQSGHAAGKAVMVGDRSYDIIGARENGLDSIGVLYGFGDRGELAGATHLAETVEDILRYV